MLDIYAPSEADIRRVQQQEQTFYWSRCADALLRKHGLVSCKLRHLDLPPVGCPIVLRGVRPPWPVADRPAVFEGPLAGETIAELGLKAETVEVEQCELLDQHRRHVAQLFYSTFSVRRIPIKPGEKTEPYPYLDPDPLWNNRTLRLQLLKPATGWTPLAHVRLGDGGSPWPIALTDGRRLVIGAPVFDVIGYLHALPALDAGFYANIKNTNLFALERWLVDRICEVAVAAGHVPAKTPIWPNGHRGALTIRHDYDRPVQDAQLGEMLAFYRRYGIRATWFLLVNKMPATAQIVAMLQAGHEVALHAEAPNFDEFRAEVEAFKALTGLAPAGYTCHGGIGSRGQLGLAQYQWSETLGLIYGEMIGRARSLPHPVHRPACGIPETGRLIVQNSHFSFDISTRPEAHQLELLKKLLPPALKSGSHVIIMSHPDIHWPELRILIERLELDGIWRCTMAEAAEWTNASKFDLKDHAHALPPVIDVAWASSASPPIVPARLLRADNSETAPAAFEITSRPRIDAPPVNPFSSLSPEIALAFDGLHRQIRRWFAENASTASPTSIAGTLRMNTTDVPMRLDRLLGPIAQHLEPRRDLAVLDVGCGYGGLPIYLASRHSAASVTAIDISDRFFRVGRDCAADLGLTNVAFRIQNLLELSETGVYDLVILSNVINYLTTGEDLGRGCANVMRALKPGGWAVVHTPHAWSYREPFTKLPMLHALPRKLRGRISRRFGKRPSFDDIRLPSSRELGRLFGRHGGVVERCEPSGIHEKMRSTHITMWVRKE